MIIGIVFIFLALIWAVVISAEINSLKQQVRYLEENKAAKYRVRNLKFDLYRLEGRYEGNVSELDKIRRFISSQGYEYQDEPKGWVKKKK